MLEYVSITNKVAVYNLTLINILLRITTTVGHQMRDYIINTGCTAVPKDLHTMTEFNNSIMLSHIL